MKYMPPTIAAVRIALRVGEMRIVSMSSPGSARSRQEAVEAWTNLARGLAASDDPADRALAQGVEQYVRSMPFVRTSAFICNTSTESVALTRCPST